MADASHVSEARMAEKMTLERMAQNANAARRVGDERTAEYWTEQVELANLQQVLVDVGGSEWDALKGSRRADARWLTYVCPVAAGVIVGEVWSCFGLIPALLAFTVGVVMMLDSLVDP